MCIKTSLQCCWQFLQKINFRTHLLISIALRLLLICYGSFHDARSELPYTDIDYKVVTDGARHVLHGKSPFERHTYRYSPLLAYMQLPNVFLHAAYGKLIYASFDIFVALLIYALVRSELRTQSARAIEAVLALKSSSYECDVRNKPEEIALFSACFWLYNPLTAIISTRGNGDSFSSFFVILTLYLLKRADFSTLQSRKRNGLIFVAGLTHGIAIHLRLYPLLFSLAYYLCLSERFVQSLRDFLLVLLRPNSRQLLLVLGTLLGFGLLTAGFYALYGWQYIYEAYLYHFVRRDVRHNFSFYFLMQYLSTGAAQQLTLLHKILLNLPQLLLVLYLSYSFGQFIQTLPFCVFALTFVMVTYNSVVTSQYFVWYLALLPLCLQNLQRIPLRKQLALFSLWLLAQGLWLLPAYLLEFKAWNTFYWIGAQGFIFFLVNNAILYYLIINYNFTTFKIKLKKQS